MVVPAKYAKPTDEVGHLVTPTLSVGTADVNYPVANITTFDPDQIFLTSDRVGADIRWDHLSAIDVQAFSLHHYNIPAGTSGVKIQRSNDASFSTKPIDYTLTIPAYPNPGLPLPIGVDLRTVAGYTSGPYRYSRLLIPDVGSPGQLTGLGSVMWWGTLREDITNVRYPVLDGETHPKRVFPTAYGNTREYRLGVRLRRHPSQFFFTTAAIYASFLALFRSCQDGTNAFLWWRNPSISDAMLMRFSDDDLLREINPCHSVEMLLVERASGLAIPT